MALDMSTARASSRWFGFSPTVVLIAAVVMLGGGAAVAKSSGPSYTEGVVALCEESNARALGDPSADGSPTDEFPGVTFFDDLSVARLRSLDALSPPRARVEDHALLQERERWVQNALRNVEEAARSGRRGAAVEPTTMLLLQVGQLDDLYRHEFGVEACGLPAGIRQLWDETMRRYDAMNERRAANPQWR